MLFVEEKEVESYLDMPKALGIIEEAFKACSHDEIFYVDRITLPVRGNESSCIWLPACMKNKPFFGIKYAASFPSNVAKNIPTVISQISLYSADSGELLGIVGANYLTSIKTGGAAGVATKAMARQDANKLGVIGTGIQAFTQILAIQEVRDLQEVYVYDLDEARMHDFIARLEKAKNRDYKIVAYNDANKLAHDCDILCTCTPSTKPVFDSSVIRKGTHVNAIGSFTPFMQEIDENMVVMADKLVTEHVDEMLKVAGDILIPLEKGLIDTSKVTGSVGDVLIGKAVGRENDDQITLYESNGSGVLDIAIATAVYEHFNQ